jgi:AAA15 family ATPase/GTPase
MLINFSIENFRSFGAEQTLNLIASGKLQGHDDHQIPIDDTGKNVLRTGVVYGANAAGKSNLVRAIVFAQSLIMGARQTRQIALNQFRFRKGKAPTSFEFRFLADRKIYTYGFAIDQKTVVEEWLAAMSPKGRDVDIFSRDKQEITIGNLKVFGEEAEVSKKALEAFLVLKPRPNQLLLNKIVELPSPSRGPLLDRVVWWFTACLTVIEPSTDYGPLIEFLGNEADFRVFAAQFLDNVGTGISGLDIEQQEIPTEKLPKELIEELQAPAGQQTTLFPGTSSVSLELHPTDPTKVIRRNLASQHMVDGHSWSIPFQQESDGTQRCLNLLPALYHLTTGCKVFVIDELDRSLHPHLSYAFLKFFVETCPRACQQMIVTTHETHLLDQDLLRRDEIWFVEKDKKQQTRLYSLADLNVRNDVRLEKGYLQGRFGGVPFIGDARRLMDLIKCPTNGKPHAKKTPS